MIRKVEELIVSPVQGKTFRSEAILQAGRKIMDSLVNRWGVLLFILGFLLGRAMIIGELAPFAIPFFAVLYHLRKDRLLFSGGAVLIGAMSHELGTPLVILMGMILFLGIQGVLEKWEKGELSYTPFAVFTSVLIAKLTYVLFIEWTGYQAMMAMVEASLSLVLTLIFVQSLPLVTTNKRTQPLKNEELVCLVILLASVMTGTVGWLIMDLSVEHILSRYAILIFAFAAGGAIGATVGVVTGIILSLANIEAMLQMSLLAFSGLLGGLLREGKKVGVAIGLLVGTLLMGLYMVETNLWITLNESLLAILLFFMTPKVIFEKISKYIPGTLEHSTVQQDYAKRLREVTANKVEQFSHVFHHLSQSFATQPHMLDEEKEQYTDLFLSQVTEKTCQVCFKKEQCWETKFDDTYRLMGDLFRTIEVQGQIKKPYLFGEWTKHCIKSQKVIEVMEQEFEQHKTQLLFKKKMSESRRLVADQLSGVSQVMTNFAREIQREGEAHHVQELQVLDALEGLGLSIRYVDIISLEEGNVDIEISQPMCQGRDECSKIVAPLLSEIVGENITVAKKECDFFSDGYCKMSLCSAKAFKIETGISSAAKNGDWVSGDSFNTMEVGNGKYALAISDGMGNGQRAHIESTETLSLLQQILQSGIEETVAIKSINSVLSLRSTEEVFSTLDLAMIDLHTAHTRFLKIGSTPSFIKRGEQCLVVDAHNLPMGIIQDIEVDVVSEQLKAGDLLIMITDGIYEAPRNIENKEMWMKRLISEIVTKDPQEVADLLLEKVVRFHQGQILDDMTVIVAKIERNMPEWSAISVAGIPKLNRKKKQHLIS
jgi:stage II sporulation protein E